MTRHENFPEVAHLGTYNFPFPPQHTWGEVSGGGGSQLKSSVPSFLTAINGGGRISSPAQAEAREQQSSLFVSIVRLSLGSQTDVDLDIWEAAKPSSLRGPWETAVLWKPGPLCVLLCWDPMAAINMTDYACNDQSKASRTRDKPQWPLDLLGAHPQCPGLPFCGSKGCRVPESLLLSCCD